MHTGVVKKQLLAGRWETDPMSNNAVAAGGGEAGEPGFHKPETSAAKDRTNTKKFSFVMCFRDTPSERKFALKSIPAAIRLGPTEFVIGIDEPIKDDFQNYIMGICEKNGFSNVKLVSVPKTKDWNFHLAHVIWECYNACTYDKILTFYVDCELRKDVMLGYDIVGSGDIAVVSFTLKLLMKTPGDCMRHAMYRLRVKGCDDVFTGTYWMYKPYYFANVKRDAFQKINNGIDGYMVVAMKRQKTHRIITRKEIGVSCMSYQNEDYPWRQFLAGIWFYANRDTLNLGKTWLKNQKAGPVTRAMLNAINRLPFLIVLLFAAMHQYPVLISGWRWAAKHRGSEAVTAATGMSYEDWTMYEYAKHMKKIKKFRGGTTGL